jgi:ABC-2 type transport system ATP-binding protein
MHSVADKTTTVRILGTLIAPTSGSASVAGIPLGSATEEEIRQRISITTEAPGLYNRLSVAENLEFFARLYGLSGRDARVYEALSAVGLTNRADDLCGSLSKLSADGDRPGGGRARDHPGAGRGRG